jgi:dihydropteroate synthase
VTFSLFAGERKIDLSSPVCMGIINATPDSFSDGSEFASAKVSHFVIDVDKVLGRVKTLIDEGARIIDIGGESTRPGAVEVSVEEELARVIPLIEAIRNNFDVCISVDTSSAVVMSEAINAGAELVNDIRALANPETLAVIANTKAAICLMHMQGQPRTMQQEYHYENVVTDVVDFLKQRIEACENAGINKERLLVDPGFGFGKSLEHNFKLLRNLTQFSSLKLPVLVGISRKSMIGRLVNRPPKERVAGSLAATVLALENGALIVRTHDVAATIDAIRVHSMYTQAV